MNARQIATGRLILGARGGEAEVPKRRESIAERRSAIFPGERRPRIGKILKYRSNVKGILPYPLRVTGRTQVSFPTKVTYAFHVSPHPSHI